MTFLLIVVAALSTRGQDIPVANTASAKDHAGQVATVCGLVTGYSCSLPEESVISLATNDRSQFTLRIPESDLQKFGRGLEDRYHDRIVCATGLVEKGGNNVRIAVTDPPAILIRPDRSFVQAARKWKFDPPMVHGKPSPLVVALSMTFTSR